MRARNVAVIAAVAGAVSIPGVSATAGPPAEPAAVSCGVERWAVKTLSDRDAARVRFRPRNTTVTALRGLRAPARLPKTRISPVEFRTYRLTALLVEAKREEDRDIHLVIADPSHRTRTMIVELPDVACRGPAGSIKRAQMQSARRRFEDACGVPSRSHFQTTAWQHHDHRRRLLRRSPSPERRGARRHRTAPAAQLRLIQLPARLRHLVSPGLETPGPETVRTGRRASAPSWPDRRSTGQTARRPGGSTLPIPRRVAKRRNRCVAAARSVRGRPLPCSPDEPARPRGTRSGRGPGRGGDLRGDHDGRCRLDRVRPRAVGGLLQGSSRVGGPRTGRRLRAPSQGPATCSCSPSSPVRGEP